MSDQTRDLRIQAYIDGEMPPAERDAFEDELAKDSSLREALQEMQDDSKMVIEALKARPPLGYSLSLKEHLRPALMVRASQRAVEAVRKQQRIGWRHVMAGAGLAAAAAAVLLVWVALSARPSPTILIGDVADVVGSPQSSYTIGNTSRESALKRDDFLQTSDELSLRTASGERLVVRLHRKDASAPSSRVSLDENTRVSVAPGREGTIWRLERGRLLATLHAAPAGAFRVETPDATFQPLGTVFQIERSEAGSRLTVKEGRVRVRRTGPTGEEATIEAGYEAVIAAAGTGIPRSRVNADAVVAWAPEKLSAGSVLRYVFRENDSLRYRGSYKLEARQPGNAWGWRGARFRAEYRIETAALLDDGSAKLDITARVLKSRSHRAGRHRTIRLPLTVTSRGALTLGKDLDIDNPYRLALAAFSTAHGLFPRLPEGPVLPGDTWSYSGRSDLVDNKDMLVSVDMEVHYTYRSDEWRGGERVLVIDVDIPRRDIVWVSGDPDQGGSRLSIRGPGSGTVRFSPTRGVVVQSEHRFEIRYDLSKLLGSSSARSMNMTFVEEYSRELIAGQAARSPRRSRKKNPPKPAPGQPSAPAIESPKDMF